MPYEMILGICFRWHTTARADLALGSSTRFGQGQSVADASKCSILQSDRVKHDKIEWPHHTTSRLFLV